jgi:serine/threonine protein kinase
MKQMQETQDQSAELELFLANNNIQENWVIDSNNIELGSEVGSGSFGVVFVAQYNGMNVAVKTVETGGNDEARKKASKLLLSEVKTLAQVVHPNVVLLIGACVNPPMLIMAYAPGGSLRSLLDKYDKGLPSDRGIEIIRGIINGMTALHAANILHLDLKPPNILMSSTLDTAIPWITDFGLSLAVKEVSSLSSASSTGAKTVRGTLQYKAPELFRTRKMGGPSYKKPADVYSFSMVAWEVFSGEVPFVKKMESEITAQHLMVALGQEDPERPELDKVPESMHALLNGCWIDSPEDRMTFVAAQDLLPENEELSIRVHERKNEVEINQGETKEMNQGETKEDQLAREEKIRKIMKEVSTSYYPSRVNRSAVTSSSSAVSLPPISSRSTKTSSSNSSIRNKQQQLQYSPPDTCAYDALSVSPGKSSTNEEMKTNDYTASDGTVFTLPSAKRF